LEPIRSSSSTSRAPLQAGGIAVLVPDFALVKEWAYAGMFFDLTGAAVASAASGNEWWHIVASLTVALVLAASWALRPEGRRLKGATPRGLGLQAN